MLPAKDEVFKWRMFISAYSKFTDPFRRLANWFSRRLFGQSELIFKRDYEEKTLNFTQTS